MNKEVSNDIFDGGFLFATEVFLCGRIETAEAYKGKTQAAIRKIKLLFTRLGWRRNLVLKCKMMHSSRREYLKGKARSVLSSISSVISKLDDFVMEIG